MVVAESEAAAQDAAELRRRRVRAELTPVIDARAALEPGAPQIWPEAPGNLAVDWPGPAADPDANARESTRFSPAPKFVARIAVMNQRMTVAAMEPRGATASYDAATDSYTLRVCSQGTDRHARPGRHHHADAEGAAAGADRRCRRRVRAQDRAYPEYIAQLVGAKKLGRPIHWMSGRSEAFLSDNQARDIYSEAELALDEKGRFLALRIRNTGNLGAYVGPVGANIPTLNFTRCLPGMYDIKHIDISARCAFTNTIHDRALSRRRPAGSELRARTRGRGSRPHDRHRSGEAAPAQSHPGVRHALQDRGRHHL